MEGRRSLADPAPSKDERAQSALAKASGEPAGAAQKVNDGIFTQSQQHAAGRQTTGDVTERFVNTKLNIALINDPENGPRFTMTKREAGLDAETSGEAAVGADMPSNGDAPPDEGASPREATTIASLTKSAAKNDVQASAQRDGDDMSELASGPAPTLTLSPPTPALSSSIPPKAVDPGKVPIDSAKTFVGLNGTYYDESWRWMDWRGTRRSWNWPAALSFGHWFAYRRLYGCAAVHLLWFASLTAAIVNNIPIIALTLPVLALVGLAGLYGNTLYFLSFRRAVNRVTERGKGSYDERRGQLAASGGTSPAAVGMMAALSIGSVIGALYACFQLRGAFLLNFWPFF